MKTITLGELRDAHARKFSAVLGAEERSLGPECEFPIVKAQGHALTLDEVRRIFAIIGGAEGWELKPSGLEAENVKYTGIFPPELHIETGYSTVEVGLPPSFNTGQLYEFLYTHIPVLVGASAAVGGHVLGYGVHPLTPPGPDLYSVLPRSRAIQALRGRFSTKVMEDHSDIATTVIASVQAQIASRGKADVIMLSDMLNGFAPEFLVFTANSRIAGGFDTGRADTRTMFYEKHQSTRAGIAPRFGTFDNYFDNLLNMPVLIINRGGKLASVSEDITLRGFVYRKIKGIPTLAKLPDGQEMHVYFEEGDIDTVETTVRYDSRIKGAAGTIEVRTPSEQQSPERIAEFAAVARGLSINWEEGYSFATSRSVADTTIAKGDVAYNGPSKRPDVVARALSMIEIAYDGLRAAADREGMDALKRLYARVRRAEAPSEQTAPVFLNEGMEAFVNAVRFQI